MANLQAKIEALCGKAETIISKQRFPLPPFPNISRQKPLRT